MSFYTTQEELEQLNRGGIILSHILRELRERCVVGVSTNELDAHARKRMEDIGGTPSFLAYQISENDPGFPGAVCISINHEVVHGLPIPGRVIRDGDIVGLDIGMWYEGLCTDMATTVMVGDVSAEIRDMVLHTREALVRGLSVISGTGRVGDIGVAIEKYIQPLGYGIVRDLVGVQPGGVDNEPGRPTTP